MTDDISIAEALQWCAKGHVRCGVPVSNAVEAYRQQPSDLTLRTVMLAFIPDKVAAQQQFDCLAAAREEDWLNRSHPEHPPHEIREASLAGVIRTIASMTDK